MTLLKTREAENKLHGLRLQDQKCSLHNLFADDSGLMLQALEENSDELKNAIATYETISSARLNISKSTIIPVAMRDTPSWLHHIGCYVAKEGDVIRYLGFPIGWKITETQQWDYILERIQRKLGSWTFWMLSFMGCMVLMKHVFKAMPNHIFTCLTQTLKALDRLEAICRRFF
ncbi:hypothetical protein R1flu_021568 [Riccia fluitans]|uniref:Reverse transcriptase domain-containing protein n=1 Tax=Riccia fluitans TaxID=41844 RepID=A0ABD1ZQ30_9MARC